MISGIVLIWAVKLAICLQRNRDLESQIILNSAKFATKIFLIDTSGHGKKEKVVDSGKGSRIK